jgi:ATP-binding cassette subfamily B protein
LWLGLLSVLLTNLAKVAAPWVLRHAIDSLMFTVTNSWLLFQGAIIVAVAILQGCCYFAQRRIFAGMARHIEFEMRNDYYAHLQKVPAMDARHSLRTGDLMARATNDLNAIKMFNESALMASADIIFAVLMAVPLMLWMSWRLTLLSLLLLPLVALSTKFFSQKVHERAVRVQEQYGKVTNRVQESLNGIRLIRAVGGEEAERDKFTQVNRELAQRNMKLVRVSALLSPLLQFLIGLDFIAVFWYGSHLMLTHQMTIGQYVQFKIYLGFLVVPVVTFGWITNLFQRGRASLGRLHEVMELNALPETLETVEAQEEIRGEIEFKNLTFNYSEQSEPVLSRINLRIQAGQTVAFVGTVGCGKSTLLNLVARMLEATSGQILIDGQRINQLSLARLRGAIGFVPQETFLFSESIADNIAFGVGHAQPSAIEQVASEAGLAADIAWLPEQYQTIVGERGVMLSGGQKQRIAIARALLKSPRILILDDALSAVDTVTEQNILSHLRRTMRDRTVLIASQRLITLREVDQIVVLDGQGIVEQGTHQELLAHGGLYAAMYEKQMLEEEIVRN